MIAYLKGTILSKKPKYLILITDKIGYQVFVKPQSAAASSFADRHVR